MVTVVDVASRTVRCRDPGRRRARGHGRQPGRQDRWSTPPRPPTWRTSSTPRRTRSPHNVLVDQRPRFAEFTADGAEVWVSRGDRRHGQRDRQRRRARSSTRSASRSRACRPRRSSRSASRITKRPHQGLRRARAGEPGGGDRRPDLRGRGVPAGRPAGLAARLLARREVPLHHQRRLQRHLGDRRRRPTKVTKSVAVGACPGALPSRTDALLGAMTAGLPSGPAYVNPHCC